jgi:hypothetical protein
MAEGMNMKERGVRFVRVRGRIIPIKISPNAKPHQKAERMFKAETASYAVRRPKKRIGPAVAEFGALGAAYGIGIEVFRTGFENGYPGNEQLKRGGRPLPLKTRRLFMAKRLGKMALIGGAAGAGVGVAAATLYNKLHAGRIEYVTPTHVGVKKFGRVRERKIG